jgi:hypothetical protein
MAHPTLRNSRPYGVVVFILILGLVLTAAPKKEYFTEDELDMIRDAQELKERVPAYIELAERRLIILGLTDKSEKQRERERKEQEKYDKEKKKAGNKGAPVKAPVDQLSYLHDFTRPELLRGYVEAIDEIMSSIDDQYERKMDVRAALEQLEKFTRETQPLLEKFEAKTDNEKKALQEAIDKAKEGNAGAKDAMKKVPKTEKKPVP